MNTPPFDPDDPRLTAYALGEGDEAERHAVEQILAASPEARLEVERTRTLALALAEDYDRQRASYLSTRPAPDQPGNIVSFPEGRGRWRKPAALAWQIAAALALTASLLYLAARRPPHASPLALARPDVRQPSLPGSEAGPPRQRRAAPDGEAPAVPPADQVAASTPSAAMKEDEGEAPAAAAGAPAAALSAAAPGGSEADRSTPASDTLALADPPKASARASTVGRGADRSLAAIPPPARPRAPEDSGTVGSLVRVRTVSGVFSGGAILTPDGLILSGRIFSESEIRGRCTVLLADGRERKATVSRPTAGWCRLQIDAAGLLPVVLATQIPSADALLKIALVDRATGAVRYVDARTVGSGPPGQGAEVRLEQSLRAAEEVSFAFNLAGELLVTAAPPQSRTASAKDKATSDAPTPTSFYVRPLSPAENSALRQPAGGVRH